MKVKIKDYEYEIVEVDINENGFKTDNDELRLYGQTIYEEQKIKIYKKLPPKRKRDTLIHELTHAFYDVYLSSYHVKDKFDEEDICCFMATYSEDILKIVDDYFNQSIIITNNINNGITINSNNIALLNDINR